VGREIIVALLATRPIGVLTNHLSTQLVRNSKAFDRSQPRDPRRPERVFGLARGGPIARDVAFDLPRDHCVYSNASRSPEAGVAVGEQDVVALSEHVKATVSLFGQRCLYFQKSGEAELVWADSK
jgi:hypothetical protein